MCRSCGLLRADPAHQMNSFEIVSCFEFVKMRSFEIVSCFEFVKMRSFEIVSCIVFAVSLCLGPSKLRELLKTFPKFG